MLELTDEMIKEYEGMSPAEQERFQKRWELRKQYEAQGVKLARDLANLVNGSPEDGINGFIEEFTQRTHRTLQQSGFGLFLKLCYTYAGKIAANSWFDLRNEYTVESSKKIMKLLDCTRPPHI